MRIDFNLRRSWFKSHIAAAMLGKALFLHCFVPQRGPKPTGLWSCLCNHIQFHFLAAKWYKKKHYFNLIYSLFKNHIHQKIAGLKRPMNYASNGLWMMHQTWNKMYQYVIPMLQTWSENFFSYVYLLRFFSSNSTHILKDESVRSMK